MKQSLSELSASIYTEHSCCQLNCAACDDPFLQALPASQLVTNSKSEFDPLQVAHDDLVVLEGCADELVWYGATCIG